VKNILKSGQQLAKQQFLARGDQSPGFCAILCVR